MCNEVEEFFEIVVEGVHFTTQEMALSVYLVSLVSENVIPATDHDYQVVYHKAMLATKNAQRNEQNRDL